MTTVSITAARPTASPLRALTAPVRWYRETPAPRWGSETAERTRFVAWVAGNGVFWTALGLGTAAAVNGLLEGLVSLVR